VVVGHYLIAENVTVFPGGTVKVNIIFQRNCQDALENFFFSDQMTSLILMFSMPMIEFVEKICCFAVHIKLKAII
jgi:hypothetical protein